MKRTEQRQAAVFVCYQRDVTGAAIEDLIVRRAPGPDDDRAGGMSKEASVASATPPAVTEFTRDLIEGVEACRDELDDLIEAQAIGWHVDRIAPLERAILRVALFEMLHRPDVPDEVAIDEAVEITKLYCGREATGFVNGILGGVLKTVRDD
jgi:transcription antitermination protein NusB